MAADGNWKAVLNDADVDTARLIVQLQMQDIADIARRDGNIDTHIAAGVWRNELHACAADLRDRRVGEDIEDEQNGVEEVFEAAAFGWSLNSYDNRIQQAPQAAPVNRVHCVACNDSFHPNSVRQMPCSHHYCQGCLERLYWDCMKDESLFPPRCCHQEFPYQTVRELLSQRLRSVFGQKRVELETTNRTYCHVPTCSAFIHPNTITERFASCPKCRSTTCLDCKNAYHGRQTPCPRDAATDALMQTANENEWQRCPGCRRVVELKSGCYHMTCICRTEFCYLCATLWKSCDCAQWDEERLIERAQAYINNGQAPATNNQDRAAHVANVVEHLRDNHECNHDRFRSIGARGEDFECEMCGEEYQDWIYQCRQCWMIVCNRCRHNRV